MTHSNSTSGIDRGVSLWFVPFIFGNPLSKNVREYYLVNVRKLIPVSPDNCSTVEPRACICRIRFFSALLLCRRTMVEGFTERRIRLREIRPIRALCGANTDVHCVATPCIEKASQYLAQLRDGAN
jgi:hypothetical protein